MKLNNPDYLNGLTVSAEQINAAVEGGGAGLTPEQAATLGKINGLQSSASEIDNTIENGTIKPLKYTLLNGTSAYVNLDQDYILANDGDYFEFVAKWNNLTSYPNTTHGMFGKNDGTNNNTIGLVASNLLYIRGETSTWMTFDINALFNPTAFNKFRLDVVGTNLRLTLNDVVFGTVALVSPITINNIGKAYGSNFLGCTIQSIEIQTTLNSVQSSDIINDSRFTNVNTANDIFYKEKLTYSYNGTDTFLVYKKQSNDKYICYIYKKKVDVTKNADNWRINIIALCNKNLVVERYLTNGGEIETAIKLREGSTQASDFMGGEFHGDEIQTSFTALIDGVKLDTSIKSSGKATKIEFMQTSNLFCPSGLTYASTKVATASKRWVFNSSTYNKLLNYITWVYAVQLQDTYLFMMPIKRTDGIGQVTDTFMVSPLYSEIDVTSSGHSNPFYVGAAFGGSAREWSKISGISVDVNIIKGWNIKPTCEFNVSPDTIFNKLYFDVTGSSTAAIGDIFDIEIEYDVYSR